MNGRHTVASQVCKGLSMLGPTLQDSSLVTLQAYIRQWKKDGMIDESKPEPWVPQGGFRKNSLGFVPLRPYPYTEEMVQSTALSRESNFAVKICQALPWEFPQVGLIGRTWSGCAKLRWQVKDSSSFLVAGVFCYTPQRCIRLTNGRVEVVLSC